MGNTPTGLFQNEQIRILEQKAISELGIAEQTLMRRAGEAAFVACRQHYPALRRIGVLCGSGNNAGDGYVFAECAKREGLTVTVYQVGDSDKLPSAAGDAYASCIHAGVSIRPFEESIDADIFIDALLGIGISGEVREPYRAAIEYLNTHPQPVIAIDSPSGLATDTGEVLGVAVKADITVTYIAPKLGLYTAFGPEYAGNVILDELDIPQDALNSVLPVAKCLQLDDMQHFLRARPRHAHKGDFGHVLVVGGNVGMMGAARMAGEAALRVGAGLVSVATHPQHSANIGNGCPELMCHGISKAKDLKPLIDKASVIAIGPGLGQDSWAKSLLNMVLASDKILLVDADGLNLIAEQQAKKDNWVLTPHPGEAARLLDKETKTIQHQRLSAVSQLQKQYGGIVVLKGVGSLVKGLFGLPRVCLAGNPGMASGGMGDVLSGVIAGLLAQKLDLELAAQLGVLLHASAGDLAARDAGERGMLATDLLPFLRQLVNADGH